jgi:hypothetical protein
MQWPPTSPARSRGNSTWSARREHVPHRHADLREDLRDLVHEGDVDVALGVLDRLGRLGALIDAARNTPPLVIAP